MHTYVVGGAVRDSLLGLTVQDQDWVVVGATPEDMLAQGFRPVGKDFPVFLHPHTHEEYALARTERKTAPGYRGFVFHTSPDVTIEQDLVRRDLTINAIARDSDGSLVDPFGGQHDLQLRVFRHVSDAFLEDPVRILRVARFAARMPAFTVAPETMALMQRMVADGEVDALVAERVWQELARGLMEGAPSRMLEVLRECGALARILPELEQQWDEASTALGSANGNRGIGLLSVMDHAASRGFSLAVRFAALLHDLEPACIAALSERLKVPADCRDLALMATREQGRVRSALELDAETLVAMFERCDGFRKPERFSEMLLAVESHAPVSLVAARLQLALGAARAVNAGAVALACGDNKPRIPRAVHAARVEAVRTALAGAAD